jgi:predicted XRE-type DNA-binding protein
MEMPSALQFRMGTMNDGQRSYQEWRDSFLADPELQRLYIAETAKKELWLQLVEARQEAGLTQAQLAECLGVTQSQGARIAKRGYEAYTLTTLRRYVQALGDGFRLEVRVRHVPRQEGIGDRGSLQHCADQRAPRLG